MTSETTQELEQIAETLSELSENLNDLQAQEEDRLEDDLTATERSLLAYNIRQLKAAQGHLDKVKTILNNIATTEQ